MFLQGETPQSDIVLFSPAFGRPHWTKRGSQSTPTNRKVHPVLFFATNLQPQKTPERPESAPVLFFTSILGPKSMLYCFLQKFWRPCHCRRNAPKLGQPPPTAAEPPWPVWRQSDLMKKKKVFDPRTPTSGLHGAVLGHLGPVLNYRGPVSDHLGRKVAPKRPPKTTRCILYCFLQGVCSPKKGPRRPRALL